MLQYFSLRQALVVLTHLRILAVRQGHLDRTLLSASAISARLCIFVVVSVRTLPLVEHLAIHCRSGFPFWCRADVVRYFCVFIGVFYLQA